MRKAPPLGAFFAPAKRRPWAALALLVLLAPSLYAEQDCTLDRTDRRTSVADVIDGDTIRLRDGEKLRFVGINTPEKAIEDRPAEPYAAESIAALKGLLPPGAMVRLRYDGDRHDRHDRLLSHVYLDNGTNVAAWLLERGYAASIAIPPNLWNQDCYRLAEGRARKDRKGIWSTRRFQPIAAADLPTNARGFYLVSGRAGVLSRHHGRWVLPLGKRVNLRISAGDQPYFDIASLHRMEHREISARGWLTPTRGGWNMTLSHPNNVQQLE